MSKHLSNKNKLKQIIEKGHCGFIQCGTCPIYLNDKDFCSFTTGLEVVDRAKFLLLSEYIIPDILEKE